MGGQDPDQFSVTYYLSLNDAQIGQNSLSTDFTNTENPQEIFARVEHFDAIGSNSGCYSISSFNIEVIGAIPELISPIEYVVCNPLNESDNQIFDLSSQNEIILENQNLTDFNVTYHLSNEDAILGNNPRQFMLELKIIILMIVTA